MHISINNSRTRIDQIALLATALPLGVFNSALAAVPSATINGPIATEAHPSPNSIYSASAIELAAQGYVEEEFFIEGTGNRYDNPPMANAQVLDSGHRYRTRLIVRRPQSAAATIVASTV